MGTYQELVPLGPVVNGADAVNAGMKQGQQNALISSLAKLDPNDPDTATKAAITAYLKAGMTDQAKATQDINIARQNRSILMDAKNKMADVINGARQGSSDAPQGAQAPDQPAANPITQYKMQNSIADDIDSVAKLPPEQRAAARDQIVAKYAQSHAIDPKAAMAEFSDLDDAHLAAKAAQHRQAADALEQGSPQAQPQAAAQPQATPVAPGNSTYERESAAIMDPALQNYLGSVKGLTGVDLGAGATEAAKYHLGPSMAEKTAHGTALGSAYELTDRNGNLHKFDSMADADADRATRVDGFYLPPSADQQAGRNAAAVNKETPAQVDVKNPDGSISPVNTTVYAKAHAGDSQPQTQTQPQTQPAAGSPTPTGAPSKRGNINVSDMVGADGKIDRKAFFNDFTAVHEGGYNPSDMNHSPTNFGINQKSNPDVDVKKITKDQAGDIAANKYFAKYKNLPAPLAAVAMDTAFINPSKAAALLKQSGGDPQKFMDLRDKWMAGMVATNPEAKKYEKAWALRNNDLRGVASRLAAGQVAAPTSTAPAPPAPSSGTTIPRVGPSNVDVARAASLAAPVVAQGAAQAATTASDNAAANDTLRKVTDTGYRQQLAQSETNGLAVKGLSDSTLTGPHSDIEAHYANMLNEFHIPVPQGIKDKGQRITMMAQLLSGNLAGKLATGSNIRNENEFNTVGKAAGQITDPPETLKFAGAAQAATAQYNRAYADFVGQEATKYATAGKPMTQSQIQNDWAASPQGKAGLYAQPAWQGVTVNGHPFVVHGMLHGKPVLAVGVGLGKGNAQYIPLQ